MPVTYERLPDFCFCCEIIGHQFTECVKYKNNKHESFAFGPWMRAVTMSECLNHNKPKDRWNRSNTTRMEETGQQEDQENQNQSQMQPNSTPETGIRIYLQALDYEIWEIVCDGPFMPLTKNEVGEDILKPSREWNELEKRRASLNSKAINALFCALDKKEFHRVSSCESANEIWHKLEVVYEGTNKVKKSKISRYTRQYELFQMEQNESVYYMYTRFTDIMNTLGALGNTFSNSEKVKKIIRSLPKEWRPKMTVIEEAKDLNVLPIDDLIGSLIFYEEDLAAKKDNEEKKKSIALKASKHESDEESELDEEEMDMLARRFRKLFKKSSERRKFRDLKNRKEKKEVIKCYKCKKSGHIRTDCPLLNKFKKRAMVAIWDDSDEETSDDKEHQEMTNLALMAIGDESDDELDEPFRLTINAEICNEGGQNWKCTRVYGHPETTQKKHTWTLMKRLFKSSNPLHAQIEATLASLVPKPLARMDCRQSFFKSTGSWFVKELSTHASIFSTSKAENQNLIHGLRFGNNVTVSHLLFADDNLIFTKATVADYKHLKAIFDRYTTTSSQLFNLDKSSMFFSCNTKADQVPAIKEIFHLNVVSKHEKYLGLPSMIGRNKRNFFNDIKLRVISKLSSWQHKHFSKGGKEVLIKAIAQAVPIYAMSVFKIPQGLCDDIQKVIAKFWWGSKNEWKGIHWARWERLNKAKCRGGMGFKEFSCFKHALVAKQGWRILQFPDSLMA
ncbi:hypothetical protein KPL71_021114 [Citrus sinensis]|uniref:Uncharacterized protein n=1 Tax=Citrus sinensis TaxID=2711 RepID=A0ACB8JF95_CITSI|nr:hypothetical protein KPL71_021114 [Citrus sinensis]